MKNRENF